MWSHSQGLDDWKAALLVCSPLQVWNKFLIAERPNIFIAQHHMCLIGFVVTTCCACLGKVFSGPSLWRVYLKHQSSEWTLPEQMSTSVSVILKVILIMVSRHNESLTWPWSCKLQFIGANQSTVHNYMKHSSCFGRLRVLKWRSYLIWECWRGFWRVCWSLGMCG